jgi:Glycine cleavage H-protein
LAMTDIPADLRYNSDHLWARVLADGSAVRVGVTDFAQQSLGDVVDVTPPRLGETVTADEVETDPATLDGQLAALMDARAYSAMVGAGRTTRSRSSPCRSPTASARLRRNGASAMSWPIPTRSTSSRAVSAPASRPATAAPRA